MGYTTILKKKLRTNTIVVNYTNFVVLSKKIKGSYFNKDIIKIT